MEIPGQEHLTMAERRPAWLKAVIDDDFSLLTLGIPEEWNFHGMRSSYEFGGMSTTSIVDELSRRVSRPLTILDIGTGAGHFIRSNEPHFVQGITAHDYREHSKYQSPIEFGDERYIIANAAHLDRIDGLLPKYDMVASRWALQHMPDPLSTLEQMANRVEVGGVLAFDNIYLNDHILPGTNLGILDSFTRAGFTLHPRFRRSSFEHPAIIPPVVMEKQDCGMPLRLGVNYLRGLEDDWYYVKL